MAFMYWFGLLSVWSTSVSAQYAERPDEMLEMACHDRYFMMAVDLQDFIGKNFRFEAVDSKGVYPITEQYAALCGYSVNILPMLGQAEIRASYFSCHTEKDDNEKYVFKFNLIATHKGREVTHTVNKTCSPLLPWSPREISCEVNYMEVSLNKISVRSDETCPSGTKSGGLKDVPTAAHDGSPAADWQVLIQNEGQLIPMTIDEAREQNYMIEVTDGRLIFRAPYGQPHSFTVIVDGVEVEMVQATLFSRHDWIVLMVDLLLACSMSGASYSDGNLAWRTTLFSPLESRVFKLTSQPHDIHSDGQPGERELYMWGSDGGQLYERELSVWVNGQLLQPEVVKEQGYLLHETNATFQISFPYDDGRGRRKSCVLNNMYHEYSVFYLYFENLYEDEDRVETRFCLLRRLATPPLLQPAFSINQTVLEEGMFTVYLGPFPGDVDMVAVTLNGYLFDMPSHYVYIVVYPNDTLGYTVNVPFEDSVSNRHYNRGVMRYRLDINCSLMILPERLSYYHLASVEASITDIFPPVFEGSCSDNGLVFTSQHKPFHSLWQAYVGPDPLTPDLAFDKGYLLNNDSEALELTVPLYRPGYTYKNVGLNTFFASFAITTKDAKTLDVQDSFVTTCPFSTTELVVCSTDGLMTVVADLHRAASFGGNPSRSTLLDDRCGPQETEGARVLFSFALGSCGSSVKLIRGHAIYENQIVINQRLSAQRPPDKVTVRCVYQLSGLYRLFLLHRFESEFPGMGSIRHSSGSSTTNATRATDVIHIGPRAFSPQQAVNHFSTPPSLNPKSKPKPRNDLPASARYVRRDYGW